MTGGFPDSRIGGTNTYKVGGLKRRLDPVIVANLVSLQALGTGTPLQRLVLKGLSGDLNIQIAAAPVGLTDSTPIIPSQVPAGFATMQLTPVVVCGNQPKIYLRPVFQNPFAAAPNSNNPLPQDLPFGWEFSTEADEVYIDIQFTMALAPSNANGNVVVQVSIEYNGQWWDTKAIQAALGQVQLTDCQTLTMGTAPS
jgi:hypothetical protein